MYTIFELTFDKKSRAIRFLYSVLYGDKQFLSNSIRILIKEKNIDIHQQRHQLTSSSPNSSSNYSTTFSVESQTQSQVQTCPLVNSTAEHDSPVNNQATEPKSSKNNSDESSDLSVSTNE